jgi:hypothetical protein
MANKIKKVSFSKFFPEDDSFVKLKGVFNPEEQLDFELDLTIQSGLNQYANICTYFNPRGDSAKSTLDQLKAIQQTVEKAIQFIEESQTSLKNMEKDIKAKRVTKTKA